MKDIEVSCCLVRRKIMSFCIAHGCKNRTSNKNYEQLEKEKKYKISFHVFPADIERKEKWLEALNLKNYKPPKSAAVCSEHFNAQNYKPNSRRLLHRDAIPTLVKEEVVNNKESIDNTINTQVLATQKLYMIQDKNTSKATLEKNIYNDKAGTSITEIKTEPIDNTYNYEYHDHIDHDYYYIPNPVEVVHRATSVSPNPVKVVHRATSVSPQRIFDSPTLIRVRKHYKEEIKKLKKQLYVSSYKYKKAREKIKSLQCIVKDLVET